MAKKKEIKEAEIEEAVNVENVEVENIEVETVEAEILAKKIVRKEYKLIKELVKGNVKYKVGDIIRLSPNGALFLKSQNII
jgi:hypothetical protein